MKRILSLILVLCAAVSAATAAFAEELDGKVWTVRFTENAEMVETYPAANTSRAGSVTGISDALSEMQPGDTAVFTMKLSNEHAQSTDWYMQNDVLQSLERAAAEGVATGGAYTYELTYTGPNGKTTEIYNNRRVGGETTEAMNAGSKMQGLEYATSALGADYIYLDTLAHGQSGSVVLTVQLDGETQGNGYQDTLAQLMMRFGVELTPQMRTERRVHHELVTTTEYHYSPVKTGDESRLLLWSVVMLGCGLAALALAVHNHKRDRRERR